MPKLPKYTFDEDIDLTGNVTSARGAVRGAMVSAGEAGNLRAPQISAPHFKPMILDPPVDDFSGKSMEGLVHFSETIRDVAFKLQEKQDDLRARKAMLETDEALNSISLEFSQTFGQESVESYPEYKKNVEELFAAKSSELSPRAREKFLSLGGTSLRQRYLRQGAGHFIEQMKNAEAQAFLVEANGLINRVEQGEDIFYPDSEGISPYDRLMSRERDEGKRTRATNTFLQNAAATIAATPGKSHIDAVKYLQGIRESRPDIVRRDPSAFAQLEGYHKTQATVTFNAAASAEKAEIKANWYGAITRVPSAIPDFLRRGDGKELSTVLNNAVGLGEGAGGTDVIGDVSKGVSMGLQSLRGQLEKSKAFDSYTDTLAFANRAFPELSGPARTVFELGIAKFTAEHSSLVTHTEAIARADLERVERLRRENSIVAYSRFMEAFPRIPKDKQPELLASLMTNNPEVYNQHKSDIEAMMRGSIPPGLTTTPDRDMAGFYERYPKYAHDARMLLQDFGASEKYPEMLDQVKQDSNKKLVDLKKNAHAHISAMFGSETNTPLGKMFQTSNLKESTGLAKAFTFYSNVMDDLIQGGMSPSEADSSAMTKLFENTAIMAQAPFMEGKVPDFDKVKQVYPRGTQTFTVSGDMNSGTEDLFGAITSRFTGQYAKYKHPENGADVGDDAALKALTGDMLSKLENIMSVLRRDEDYGGLEAAFREYQVIQAQASFIQQHPDSVSAYLAKGARETSGGGDSSSKKTSSAGKRNPRAQDLK